MAHKHARHDDLLATTTNIHVIDASFHFAILSCPTTTLPLRSPPPPPSPLSSPLQVLSQIPPPPPDVVAAADEEAFACTTVAYEAITTPTATFWMACASCRLLHEFKRKHVGYCLTSPSCRLAFLATM
jgi:hypothetical protein